MLKYSAGSKPSRNASAAFRPFSTSASCRSFEIAKSVVLIANGTPFGSMTVALTANVRTCVECVWKRKSQASWAVWKMSKALRAIHGRRCCSFLKPPPTPLPPVSVKPNVGHDGFGLSNSHTGKFDSVPPSTTYERTGFPSGAPR